MPQFPLILSIFHPNGVVYTVTEEMTELCPFYFGELGHEPVIERNCAKVSVVGAGINGVPGVAAKIVTALSEKEISILQSATAIRLFGC